MDLIDCLNQIASKIVKQKNLIATEEATKSAFIMPFISSLGYDVFDPEEVIPEFTADIGIKKGEKVDYAISVGGKISVLIECKMVDAKLDAQNESQLHRYFHTTEARIGVLTDGIIYKFYTDLDEPNKMDNKPFLEFSITNIDEIILGELKKFTKVAFDIDNVLSSASELKYTKVIKNLINEQLTNPSDEFVKFVLATAYPGRVTAQVKEQFTPVIAKAFQHFINDKLNDRLKSALSIDVPVTNLNQTESAATVTTESVDENKIITTQEELEGFYVVKSVLKGIVDLSRVKHRDTQSYFGILLDDNNRKPITRLYFNGSKKYISVFTEDKREEKIAIVNVDDIFDHKERIIASANIYLIQPSVNDETPYSDSK
jgi:predicted type IV restriction endonuclease